ncbi:MAG: hypothetical protein J6K29_08320 [Clostridia bacterium]|nr:hypothetical protein [Clostridia bacterium]
MFGKMFRRKNRLISVEDFIAGKLSAQEFADLNADATVCYSTPFGEDRAGRTRLWVLSNHENDLQHYPAFTAKAECNRFLAAIGRQGFPIIEGDLRTLLDSLDSHEALAPLGVVIDPQSPEPIAIDPGVRVGTGIKE